jgi:hypothetical protein
MGEGENKLKAKSEKRKWGKGKCKNGEWEKDWD